MANDAPVHFPHPVTIVVDNSRWQTTITVLDPEGNVVWERIASADSAFTWGDGIWFGDRQEYDETYEELMRG